MKKNSWLEEFEVEKELGASNYSKEISNDYEIFKDKDLLDKFRNRIIQELIDNQIPDEKLLTQYINEEIDRITEGYDLSNVERNHIFNLIENEINGFGPITELLQDKNVTEIMVNGPDEIYIEVDGQLIRDDTVSFINDDHFCLSLQLLFQQQCFY